MGVTAADERFSLIAATIAMTLLSLLAAVGQWTGLNPFALGFNAAFVYLPTLILFFVALWMIVIRPRRNPR